MTEPPPTEQKLVRFLSEFMSITPSSRAEPLGDLLTSIQQYELMLFVEDQLGVVLDPSYFIDAGSITLEALAAHIDASRARG